ncbi:MAG: transglycosylase domain-containing protein [Actinomycetota bacterium]|nr:transglycosylase domain-containing protein [Actinomycetota bacterium]
MLARPRSSMARACPGKGPSGRRVRWLGVLMALAATATSCYRYEAREFEITIPEQAESSVVVDRRGRPITTLVAPENRTSARTLDEIPEMVRNAVIAIEDERFFIHEGMDLKAIVRAARSNLEAGGISQGGSTITQQYVKLAIIRNSEQTASRKLEELWYATRLEDRYSKEFILLQYLNTVYFGHGAYGVKAASQTYFNKDISEVNLSEAALLAGIIQLPGRYNPFVNYSKSLRRSHQVLDRMLANDYITVEQRDAAVASPPRLEEYTNRLETRYPAGHFVDEVRRWILDNPAFGASRGVRERLLFEGGLRIETTVDLDLQAAAEQAVENHMPAGRGHPDAAVVLLETGTGKVLAMVGGRDFFADDEDAKVNLAVGSGRQVGSSMKPVALAAALEAGWRMTATYTAPNVLEFEIPGADEDNRVWRVTGGVNGHDATEARFEHGIQALLQFWLREEHTDVPDGHAETIRVEKERDGETEVTYQEVDLAQWVANRRWDHDREQLFADRIEQLEAIPTWSWDPPDGRELTPPPDAEEVTLIRATRSSLNTVYAQLSMELGALRTVNMARRLGIRSPIQPVNSNVLGTSNATMLDMATAYHTLANRGVAIAPSYVSRVTRADGTTLWSWTRSQSRAIDARLADRMTWILEGTIEQGTGWRAQLEGRPAAGKTGTTQNYADAVFAGYTPQVTAAVWVGFPEAQIPMIPPTTERKVYGGTWPAMIWKDVMEFAHLGLPAEDFPGLPTDLPAAVVPAPSTPFTPGSPEPTIPAAGTAVDGGAGLGTEATPTALPQGMVATPEVVGLTLANARKLLGDADHGVWIAEVREIEASGTEPGTILRQDPDTGTAIAEGGTLVVDVAVEPPEVDPFDMPDVMWQVLLEARPVLESLGLGYAVTIVADPDQPEWEPNLIWKQDPLPDAIVAPGTVVELWVTP